MFSLLKSLFKKRVPQDHVEIQMLLLDAHTRLHSKETLNTYNQLQEVLQAVELLKQAQKLTGENVLTLESGNIERSFKLKACGKLRVIDHNGDN